MAVMDEAIAMGAADPAHLGVGGWSYGGFLTNVIVTRTNRFRAAVSGAGIANLIGLYVVSDTDSLFESGYGLPWEDLPRWQRASPFFSVSAVSTPMLVLCGQTDLRTPVSQSEQSYKALRRLGKEAQLVIYPGEGHALSNFGNERDRLRREISWYNRFVKQNGSGAVPSDRRSIRPPKEPCPTSVRRPGPRSCKQVRTSGREVVLLFALTRMAWAGLEARSELITQRSQVQILPPLPNLILRKQTGNKKGGPVVALAALVPVLRWCCTRAEVGGWPTVPKAQRRGWAH